MTSSPTTFGIATIQSGDEQHPAMVTESGVALLSEILGQDAPASVRHMVTTDWHRWCDRIASALTANVPLWASPAEFEFAAPLPDPTNLYMAGANYYDHVKEMLPDQEFDKTGQEIFHFMVPTASLTGTGHDVMRPANVTKLDWEVEVAVVIDRRADAVSVADALTYVAGYTVANDVSVRDASMYHPIFGVRFLFAKGQASLTPMGPAIVPARFVPRPGDLGLSTRINGVTRQKSTTSQMIWSIPEQISFLSHQAPLLPGDVILTGTPAGTAAAHGVYLDAGDEMVVEVEGLGTLVNRVVERTQD
jgi:2-keto-4-pentenoate hydratase/2-oxohepta-3-ene-1,7-dioic acid hydratase in catechol pathway